MIRQIGDSNVLKKFILTLIVMMAERLERRGSVVLKFVMLAGNALFDGKPGRSSVDNGQLRLTSVQD